MTLAEALTLSRNQLQCTCPINQLTENTLMSEDTDLKPVAAIQTPDGVLHATEADAQAHLENVKIAPVIRNFIAYRGIKGRGVRVTFDTVMEFLRWNRAGQPAPAPKPAPEANQETPPVEEPAAE